MLTNYILEYVHKLRLNKASHNTNERSKIEISDIQLRSLKM